MRPPVSLGAGMRRREFLGVLGGAATGWPLAVSAQPAERLRRIGVLMGGADDAEGRERLSALQQGLRAKGWNDANLQVDERWSFGRIERVRSDAASLLEANPNVVVAGGILALVALRQRTQSTPIVFVATNDPVAQGFVPSMARPGGNITGFSVFEFSVIGKMLGILKEIAPKVRRCGLLINPDNDSADGYQRAFMSTAASLDVEPVTVTLRAPGDIDQALAQFAQAQGGGLVVTPDVFLGSHRDVIAATAIRNGLPLVGPYRAFARSGAPMS